MALNTKEYTFIGESYFEIVQAYFAAIASYPNVTGDGVTVASTQVLETFTVTDGELTYKFGLKATVSNQYTQSNPYLYAFPYSTETSSTTYQISNNSYSIFKNCIWGSGKKYSHARMFYDANGNFVAASALYAENYTAPSWFAILHIDNDPTKPVWVRGRSELFDLTVSSSSNPLSSLYIEYSMSTNHETAGTVYIEEMTDSNGDMKFPDLFILYNNTFYNYNKTTNGFLFVNTERGQYMRMALNVWFKIDSIGENETYIYNG